MRVVLMLLAIIFSIATSSVADDAIEPERSPRIRVLLLSGQNNHDWQKTTPAIQTLLAATGRFDVHITEQPEHLTAEMLEPYDVIVSNWNMFGAQGSLAAEWPKSTQEAYVKFIRDGNGHVVVHAGSSSFAHWTEYQKLSLATWGKDQTGHGPRHEFPVRIDDANHAITRGLANFTTRDELWHRPAIQPHAKVIASALSAKDQHGSGQYEPVAMVGRFGQGRSFTLLLGHDVEGIQNAGFAKLLARGTQWAATGRCDAIATDKAAPSLAWKRSDSTVSLLAGKKGADKKTVWQFHYGADISKPFFHPLALPSGPVLTTNAPVDHPWHHGLWFSWKHINGVNYWEEDRKTGQSAGKTEWDDVEITTREDHSARIDMRLHYHPTGSEKDDDIVLKEHRTIEISAPGDDDSYTMDWTIRFTAGRRGTKFDRTPIPGEAGGVSWGGYAGLSVRLTSQLAQVRAVAAEGPVDLTAGTHRGKSVALDYAGRIADQEAGIAIVDHPNNLNAPSPWYVIQTTQMNYFSPAVICFQPHTLEPGENMTLRYRVVVHPGRLGRDQLTTAYNEFVKTCSDE